MHLDETIDDIVCGEEFEVPRTVVVSDILPDTLAKAWFTVKRRIWDTDAVAVFQKTITTSLNGDGQITVIGATDVDAELYFLLSASDTALLDPNVLYFYDIKCLSSAGAPKVVEGGRLSINAAITQAEG